jgi:glucose-6-phosphate isomerase
MNTKKINPYTITFDLQNGLSSEKESTKRYLSDMSGMFADEAALASAIERNNEIIYEFYELDIPATKGDLQFGTSIVYPGTIGGEYYMTKGHFHIILDTAETYFCLAGQGYMLVEDPEGNWEALEVLPGRTVYVPGRYAHRSINTGTTPLITYFTYRADAGQDYKTIETKGFRKLLVARGGKPAIVDNPKWAV